VAVPGAQGEVPERRVKFSESVAMYFEEKSRTDALAVKTERDKRDAFSLLSEITGDKPLAEITKEDAREVKQVVMRLPKNRRKNPKTRDKTLFEMLEVEGVELLSARSV
ncbi:MAG: hypothetical protein OIF40_05975, partial [Mangrovicoccus sp.]|nr:hypothetical protein [Mangrovicoccus sp.]